MIVFGRNPSSVAPLYFFYLQLVSQGVTSIITRSNEGEGIGFSGQVAGVCFPVVNINKGLGACVPALNYGINN